MPSLISLPQLEWQAAVLEPQLRDLRGNISRMQRQADLVESQLSRVMERIHSMRGDSGGYESVKTNDGVDVMEQTIDGADEALAYSKEGETGKIMGARGYEANVVDHPIIQLHSGNETLGSDNDGSQKTKSVRMSPPQNGTLSKKAAPQEKGSASTIRGRGCSVKGCTNFSSGKEGVCISHGGTQTKKICSVEGCTRQSRGRVGVCIRHGAPEQKRRYCSSEGCTNLSVGGAGVCIRHGAPPAKKRKCSVDGCTRQSRTSGVCIGHGAPQMKKKCSVDGCANQSRTSGVCVRHGAPNSKRVICSAEGCSNQVQSNGVCKQHGAVVPTYEKKHCSVDGCTNLSLGRMGVCFRHGASSKKKKCSVEGCDNYSQKLGLCIRHGSSKRATKVCCHEGCTKAVVKKGVCREHGGGDICDREGCSKYAMRRGLCHRHGAAMPD